MACMVFQVAPSLPLLGIKIAPVTIPESVDFAIGGGLILAPSAPGLSDLSTDPDYREALRDADLNLPDSGLAIILMSLLGMGCPPRTSGLGFIEALLASPGVRNPGATFWVMPSPEATARNLRWLNAQGIPVSGEQCYLAPKYPASGPLEDAALLARIEAAAPRYVILCIGGGPQERLGLYLKRRLSYRPAICCIGAAIGFLTGDQVAIPRWADRLCLGWLFRTISEPRRFAPRYLKALKLVWLILRYRDQPPPIKGVN